MSLWVRIFQSTVASWLANMSLTDRDSFLPSAIQRYHQLFMPVLQLIGGILATLGAKHITAAHQVSCPDVNKIVF